MAKCMMFLFFISLNQLRIEWKIYECNISDLRYGTIAWTNRRAMLGASMERNGRTLPNELDVLLPEYLRWSSGRYHHHFIYQSEVVLVHRWVELPSEDLENKEVTWDVQGATVAATITAPNGKGPRPAVVLVAGSGPTDRDWCTPLLPGTNGSARLIAEALASRGFVTIRYDKIAAGPNAEREPRQVHRQDKHEVPCRGAEGSGRGLALEK